MRKRNKIRSILNPPMWKVKYHHLGMGDDCVAYIRCPDEIDVFNKLMENENGSKLFIDSMICEEN